MLSALNRLRPSLILIIGIFSVATAGLALIPGVPDENGDVTYLTLFQSLYFVSYTATTIGFGEIPRAFSDVQRLWVLVTIYASVIGWAFLLASIVELSQDKGLRQAMRRGRFRRSVARIGEPFFVICGLGETGRLVAQYLAAIDRRFVVVDLDENKIQMFKLEEAAGDAPTLAADVREPQTMLIAGMGNPHCAGVMAITSDDRTNLQVALTVHLLRASVPVIVRSETAESAAAMQAVGCRKVINPFHEFSQRLAIALHAPNTHELLAWLTARPGASLPRPIPPPPGRWIVCGFGRFGTEVANAIRQSGFDVVVVEPRATPSPADAATIRESGTDADALERAGIRRAAGLVAGTNDDTANLAIATIARETNPTLFVIIRQNLVHNQPLFEAVRADVRVVSSQIIADACVAALRTPLLSEFLQIVEARDDAWAADLLHRLRELVDGEPITFWSSTVSPAEAPGLMLALTELGSELRLADFYRDAFDRGRAVTCAALLLQRSGALRELPAPDAPIATGDRLLFAGTAAARRNFARFVADDRTATYVLSGRVLPEGALLRWISARRSGSTRPHKERSPAKLP